jgi:hypothetical protein
VVYTGVVYTQGLWCVYVYMWGNVASVRGWGVYASDVERAAVRCRRREFRAGRARGAPSSQGSGVK